MAQIRGGGFVVQPLRGSSGFLLPARSTGAAVLLILATSWMHAQSASTSNSTQNAKPVTSAADRVPAKELAPPATIPPRPLPGIGQEPTRPPTVTWDGKQLTIDAENSTLADILSAVRETTGASIDMPGSASMERVFVHLGPGPPRDILSEYCCEIASRRTSKRRTTTLIRFARLC